MKKILPMLLLSMVAALAFADEGESEPDEAQPSAGHIMLEMGYRYSALYFAARQKRWEFAAYQLEEMEEALRRLAFLKPRLWHDIGEFRATALHDLAKTLPARDWELFAAGFEKLRAGCAACHAKNGVGFIELPVPKRHFSPALE
jgi:hypothetical protein